MGFKMFKDASNPPPKVLILRFSSLGDIAQAMDIPAALKHWNPQTQVHWAVRADFKTILDTHPDIDFVWPLERTTGLQGLFQLVRSLKRQNFTHIYDAHNNLRSNVISALLWAPHFVRRPKNRWKRWMLFRLRINYLPVPFQGRKSFLEPLLKWGIRAKPQQVHLELGQGDAGAEDYLALAPSAAWKMKRWPVDHWKNLIQMNPTTKFVILGGLEDEFLNQLSAQNTKVVAGKMSLIESLNVIRGSRALVSNDTGLLHYADVMGVPSVAIIGPTAFGYPSGANAVVAEIELECKPCSKDGRGPCSNNVYQKCLLDLTPQMVNTQIARALAGTATHVEF